ncbi:MAG: hypothetical protein JXR60_10385 [Bacteroidales bacterium]|nr:hypothetical protein [Bacteroidales bacterium]
MISDPVLSYFTHKGLEVNLLNEYVYYHSTTPYAQYIYNIDKRIICIIAKGESHKNSYKQSLENIQKTLKGFFSSNPDKNFILLHQYEDLKNIPFSIRKEYAKWLNEQLIYFKSIAFYKPNPMVRVFLNAIKVFNTENQRIKILKNHFSLQSYFEEGHLVGQKNDEGKYIIHSKNLLKLLDPDRTLKKTSWLQNIDYGRLQHEALLIDQNIIIRHLRGSMAEGDIKIIEETNREIKSMIQPQHAKYISLIDLENFNSISIKARKESLHLFDDLFDEMQAIIFFNCKPYINLAIKLTSAIKPSLKEKVYVVKNLKFALKLAMELKGVQVISMQGNANSSSNIKFSKSERLLHKPYIETIEKLSQELDNIKAQNKMHSEKLMSQLSRISWDEDFLPIDTSRLDENDPFSDLYIAISLLHQDIQQLILNSNTDS